MGTKVCFLQLLINWNTKSFPMRASSYMRSVMWPSRLVSQIATFWYTISMITINAATLGVKEWGGILSELGKRHVRFLRLYYTIVSDNTFFKQYHTCKQYNCTGLLRSLLDKRTDTRLMVYLLEPRGQGFVFGMPYRHGSGEGSCRRRPSQSSLAPAQSLRPLWSVFVCA